MHNTILYYSVLGLGNNRDNRPSWSHDNRTVKIFLYRPQYYRQYHDYCEVY